MEPRCALPDPVEGQVDRILRALDDLVVVAFAKAHSPVAEDVHRRDHFDRKVEPHDRMLAC